MNLRRILKRALFYIITGYGLASLPFVFLGYASSIYYLAIGNIPFLHDLFPNFHIFLSVAAITLPILCGLVGYSYMKVFWFFKESQEITTESNPYSNIKIAPVTIPYWIAAIELFKQHGIDTKELELIIKRSKQT